MISTAILAGLMLGIGFLLIASAWIRSRQVLYSRVMGAVAPASKAIGNPIGRWLAPVWEKLGSTSESVSDRLSTLQLEMTVERFRLQQVLAGFAGAGLMVVATAGIAAVRPVSVLVWIILVLLGLIVGTLVFDKMLTWRVDMVSRRISHQVAEAAELLALSVSAGESIPAALRRVQNVVGPELAMQLGRTLELIDTGTSVTRALVNLRDKTRSPQLGRLLDTLISAMERGAPLTTTLREQARDLRDEDRRAVMELGGRKEIAMLFPVVFIILPVTVVFALYPGLMALRF